MEQVPQQSAVALGQSVTDTSVSTIQLILFPHLFCYTKPQDAHHISSFPIRRDSETIISAPEVQLWLLHQLD